MLDYACGEALETPRVAAAVGKLVLCDGAPSVVAKLRERFGSLGHVAFALPEDLDAALPDGTADLIVVSSLIQYLSREDLVALLGRFRAKLKPSGASSSPTSSRRMRAWCRNVLSLLRNALRHGYLPRGRRRSRGHAGRPIASCAANWGSRPMPRRTCWRSSPARGSRRRAMSPISA